MRVSLPSACPSDVSGSTTSTRQPCPGSGTGPKLPIQQHDALAHAPQAEARRSLLVDRLTPLAVVQHGQFHLSPSPRSWRGAAALWWRGHACEYWSAPPARSGRASGTGSGVSGCVASSRSSVIRVSGQVVSHAATSPCSCSSIVSAGGFVGAQRLDGVTDVRQAGFRYLSCLL